MLSVSSISTQTALVPCIACVMLAPFIFLDRHRILGILTEPTQYQLVFSDTPGMLTPAYKLQETMQETVRGDVQ